MTDIENDPLPAAENILKTHEEVMIVIMSMMVIESGADLEVGHLKDIQSDIEILHPSQTSLVMKIRVQEDQGLGINIEAVEFPNLEIVVMMTVVVPQEAEIIIQEDILDLEIDLAENLVKEDILLKGDVQEIVITMVREEILLEIEMIVDLVVILVQDPEAIEDDNLFYLLVQNT